MTRYIVFEPSAGSGEAPGPSDRAVMVRDALARWAILFPFLWLFRHGLILAGLVVLAAEIAFGLMAGLPGLGPAAFVLPLALGLLVALEGPSLRAARHRRLGFREAAVVDAADETEAAILYYAGAAEADEEPALPIADRVPRQPPPRAKTLFDPQGYR